jgi:phenylacetic acid degradation operon negative regulatory protein
LIFNLFGDYVYPRRVAVPTAGLLKVLALLGVSERAARSTLSRMKGKGWLRAHRKGRRSLYSLTPRARALLEEGSRRLFGPPPQRWDGRWHLVIYSLPQEMRSVRHQLRTRLSWLGYGMLQPGSMVSANPRRQEVENLIAELNVGPYVHAFSQAHLDNSDPQHVVGRCWDLPALNERYARFIERHQPLYESFLQQQRELGSIPQDEAFKFRFWVTYEFSSFPRQDPNLPPELLPPGWLGRRAAQLLADYRALLKEPAEAFINRTLNIEPVDAPELEAVTLMPG